jgi:tRNA (guanosine-2'-O-)-methyltransferase
MTSTRRTIEDLSRAVRPGTPERLRQVLSQRTRRVTAVLEDLYDSRNAGAIIRTCECLGLQEVHVIVNRNSFRPKSQVLRGSAGWLELVKHLPERAGDDGTAACFRQLRDRGYRLAATTLRTGPGVLRLEELPIDRPVALCFGLEQTGLSETAHATADFLVAVPMAGFTQSLNVASCAAICLYDVVRRVRAQRDDWRLAAEDREAVLRNWLEKSVKKSVRKRDPGSG